MTQPLFSRPIRVEAIPREGLETRIEADDAERAALAKFNGLAAIAALAAKFSLKHGAGGAINLHGALDADVSQTCVVSLEPFAARISARIDMRFAPSKEVAPRRVSISEAEEIDVGVRDDPDPIVDGAIDLGAVASEFLTLSLDPYPRKPGIVFEPPVSGDDPREASPFSALAARKKDD